MKLSEWDKGYCDGYRSRLKNARTSKYLAGYAQGSMDKKFDRFWRIRLRA